MQVRKLIEVFGAHGVPLASYVERRDIERAFEAATASGKHVILFGPPGHGKTSLLRRQLRHEEVVLVQCTRKQRLPDLYRYLLAESGASVTTQRRLTRDLKFVFETSPIRFIILGSWSGPARFMDLNEDATGCVSQIYVRPWTDDELMEVIESAQYLLNVYIPDPMKLQLAEAACGCVRNLSEICFDLFAGAGVMQTQTEQVEISDPERVTASVESVYRRPFSRYRDFLQNLCEQQLHTSDGVDVVELTRQAGGNPSGPDLAVAREELTAFVARKNQEIYAEVGAYRCLVDFLISYDWLGGRADCTLQDLITHARESFPQILYNVERTDRKRSRNTVREFIARAVDEDIRPGLLEFDRVDSSIRIVDSKFLSYLVIGADRGELFRDEHVPVRADHWRLARNVKERLRERRIVSG